MERLTTDAKLKPLVAQFVPIKIDVASPDYQLWTREHTPERGAIPQMFIVRADGHELYNRVGALPADDLVELLSTSLGQSGIAISELDAQAVVTANATVRDHLANEDSLGAAQVIVKIPNAFDDAIPCFAIPVVELRESVAEVRQLLESELSKISSSINEFSESNLQEQIACVERFQRLTTDLKRFKPLNKALADLRSSATRQTGFQALLADLSSLQRMEASKSVQRTEKLDALAAQYANTALAPRIEAVLVRSRLSASLPKNQPEESIASSEELLWKSVADQVEREWTSTSGKYKIMATLLASSAKSIRLRTTEGNDITVAIDQLSAADIRWLESIRD